MKLRRAGLVLLGGSCVSPTARDPSRRLGESQSCGSSGRRRGGGFIFFFLLLFSCDFITQPSGVPPKFPEGTEQLIRGEWAICQNILRCLGYDVERFTPEQFRWVAHSSTFNCAGGSTSGCFTPDERLIEFYTDHYWAVRHECGHATLWALDHKPGYLCFGHGALAFNQEFCEIYYPKETFWERFCPIQ